MQQNYQIILLIAALIFWDESTLATHLPEEVLKDTSSNAGHALSQGSTSLRSPGVSDSSNSQPGEGTKAKKPQNKFDEYYSGFGMLMHQQ